MKTKAVGLLAWRQGGFTRRELVILIFTLTIAVAIGIPLLQKARTKSQIQQCQSNLATIHQGLMQSREPETKRFHWQSRQFWGSRSDEKPGEVWFYMSKASNHLASPKVLVCPADARKPATDWSPNVNGLAHADQIDKAISYFLAVDTTPFRPKQILLGDRNIPIPRKTRCGHLMGEALPVLSRFNAQQKQIHWDETLHKARGHIMTAGGTLAFINSKDLQTIIMSTDGDSCYDQHYIFPEPTLLNK